MTASVVTWCSAFKLVFESLSKTSKSWSVVTASVMTASVMYISDDNISDYSISDDTITDEEISDNYISDNCIVMTAPFVTWSKTLARAGRSSRCGGQ
jgi:hypothetical protein